MTRTTAQRRSRLPTNRSPSGSSSPPLLGEVQTVTTDIDATADFFELDRGQEIALPAVHEIDIKAHRETARRQHQARFAVCARVAQPDSGDRAGR